LLDSWAVGNSRSVSAGNNRLLIIVVGIENANPCDITNISFGGINLTQSLERHITASFDAGIEFWIINEVGIVAAGPGPKPIVVTRTTSTSFEEFSIVASATYTNVDQVSPIFNSQSYQAVGVSSFSVPPSFSTSNGSMTFGGSFTGANPSGASAN
jgi:hypothetical protein